MSRFVLRVWLDDRPGALGAVASRIGSVRGDLVGIEILERGGGRAIDELHVELPDDSLVDLMVREIMEVDGVDVEDVRPARATEGDGRVEVLRAVRRLCAHDEPSQIYEVLGRYLFERLNAEWLTLIDVNGNALECVFGEPPSLPWLLAYLEGARYAMNEAGGSEDVAWVGLGQTSLRLVVGRTGRPYRQIEREELEELGALAEFPLTRLRSC